MFGNEERQIAQRAGAREELVPEECRLGETVKPKDQGAENSRCQSSQYDGARELDPSLAHRSRHCQGNDAKEDNDEARYGHEARKLDQLVGTDRSKGDKPRHIVSTRATPKVE